MKTALIFALAIAYSNAMSVEQLASSALYATEQFKREIRQGGGGQTCEDKTCVTVAGGACDKAKECGARAGDTCKMDDDATAGTCEKAPEGNPNDCSTTQGKFSWCNSVEGFYCDQSTCTAKLAVGATCTEQTRWNCETNHCVDGKCKAKVYIGDTCTTGDDCNFDGVVGCVSGKCAVQAFSIASGGDCSQIGTFGCAAGLTCLTDGKCGAPITANAGDCTVGTSDATKGQCMCMNKGASKGVWSTSIGVGATCTAANFVIWEKFDLKNLKESDLDQLKGLMECFGSLGFGSPCATDNEAYLKEILAAAASPASSNVASIVLALVAALAAFLFAL